MHNNIYLLTVTMCHKNKTEMNNASTTTGHLLLFLLLLKTSCGRNIGHISKMQNLSVWRSVFTFK